MAQPDDGDSKYLRNIGQYVRDYNVPERSHRLPAELYVRQLATNFRFITWTKHGHLKIRKIF